MSFVQENPDRANGQIFNVGNPNNEVTVRQLAEMMTEVKDMIDDIYSFYYSYHYFYFVMRYRSYVIYNCMPLDSSGLYQG